MHSIVFQARNGMNVYNSSGMALTNLTGEVTSQLVTSDYPSATVPASTIAFMGVSFNGSTQAVSKPLAVFSYSDATSGTTDTGSLFLQTGNKTGGTANSGNIELYIGTANGTRGKIKFNDGSEGIAGQVWTSTDTVGSGHWAEGKSPSGTICGWSDGVLSVNCKGADPSVSCPTGYTQNTTATGVDFCSAN